MSTCRLPEMHETAQRMEAMFHLPGYSYGIDGVHMIFADRPVAFLTISMHNSFFCRNPKFSVNVQVVGTDKRISDIDVQWPGSVHDARVYRLSEVKRIIEEQHTYKVGVDDYYKLAF